MTQRYIYSNNQTSTTTATDTQLNTIFGVGNWQQLPNPPSNFIYSEWNDTDKKWVHTDLRTYSEKRQAEYPPIGDQLDMIYHDKVNGTHNWQTTIAAVKNKYPKDKK